MTDAERFLAQFMKNNKRIGAAREAWRKAHYYAALTVKYQEEGRKAEAKKAKGHALRWTRELMRLEGKL